MRTSARVFSAAFLALMMMAPIPVFSQEDGVSSPKSVCVRTEDLGDKSLSEIKGILLERAKQEALSEILQTKTTPTGKPFGATPGDLGLSDLAADMVHVKGAPRFFSGPNFGELCLEGLFFIAEANLEKLTPQVIEVRDFCYSNETLPVGRLKEAAKREAVRKALIRINPAMINADSDALDRLGKDAVFSNEKLDLSTLSYCCDLSLSVTPLAIEQYRTSRPKPTSREFEQKPVKSRSVFTLNPSDYGIGDPLKKYGSMIRVSRNPYVGKGIGEKTIEALSSSSYLAFNRKNVGLPDDFTVSFRMYVIIGSVNDSMWFYLDDGQRTREDRILFCLACTPKPFIEFVPKSRSGKSFRKDLNGSSYWTQIRFIKKGDTVSVFLNDEEMGSETFRGMESLNEIRIELIPKTMYTDVVIEAE